MGAENRRSGSYGYILQGVVRDKRLSVEAKAVYAYLSSFADSDGHCFPAVDTICGELGMSKKLVIRISQPFIETLFKSLGSLLQDIKNLLVLELSRTIHNRKSKMVTSFSGLKNSALVETDRETSFLNLEKDHWAYSYNGLAEELVWAWAIRATSVLKTICPARSSPLQPCSGACRPRRGYAGRHDRVARMPARELDL